MPVTDLCDLQKAPVSVCSFVCQPNIDKQAILAVSKLPAAQLCYVKKDDNPLLFVCFRTRSPGIIGSPNSSDSKAIRPTAVVLLLMPMQ